ncbi:MAG: hypothetical protein V4495_04910 [Pseudomonadota bacterium]
MSLQKIIRVIVMFICLILMIGFGACSIFGLTMMVDIPFNLNLLALSTLGFGICAACGFLIWKLFVSMRKSDADKVKPE